LNTHKFFLLNYLRVAVLASLACAGTAVVPASPAATNSFDVREFGAKGDGKTLDSPAINQAIEAAAKAGGGTVFFPAGTYLSGSIHLQSHITLYLDAGCTIIGAPDGMNAFDPAEPSAFEKFQDFGHNHWHNSLIWGENLEDIAIVGQGTINGGGMTKGSGDVRVPDGNGNKSISLKLCRNINLRDISIAHGGHFAILLTGCDNVSVENLKIDTNRDGMDIDCCRNVRVSNCTVNSPNDDAICPKSSYALGYNRATEDVTITGCLVSGYKEGSMLDGTFLPTTGSKGGPTGRIKCGTESNGGFKNIAIANCVFDHCRGIALEAVDGGDIDGVAISNITMRHCGNSPIFIRLGARLRGPDGTVVGVVRNIDIDNVVVVGADKEMASIIAGIPGHDIENVRLTNIRVIANGGGTRKQSEIVPDENLKAYPDPRNFGIIPAYGFFCRHVKGIEFHNINLTFATEEQRPAFVLNEVAGADFDFIKAQQSTNGLPSFQLQAVEKFSLRNSPDLENKSGTFAEATRF
jgi:polygalacturonase